MKKVIVVKTDDPKKRKFNLIVRGSVEKVVDISPASVFLNGKPGDTLESVIKITPSEKYSFSILGMEQKPETKIKTRLIKPRGDEKIWQIKIKTQSDKPANLFDVLTIKTDSEYLPELAIRVYAIFASPPEPQSIPRT